MRTTVTLAPDVAAEVERLKRERAIGVSEAVNELIRAGLSGRPRRKPFRQRTEPLGIRIDVTDVSRAIEELEGASWR